MEKTGLFKEFVKDRVELIDLVHSNKYSWQQLYEYFDLYGDNAAAWDKIINAPTPSEENKTTSNTESKKTDDGGILKLLTSIDPSKLNSGIESAQKILNLLSVFVKEDGPQAATKTKQFFRRFDD